MVERRPTARRKRKNLVMHADYVVPDSLLSITRKFGERIFEPGESNVTLTHFSERSEIPQHRVHEQVGQLLESNRLKDGLTPQITVTEGTLAEESAGIARLADRLLTDANFLRIVSGDDAPELPSSKRAARTLAGQYLDAQKIASLQADAEGATETQRVAEMSTADIVAALWNRQEQIARPYDPIDVRFDRFAALKMAEAVINGDDVYVPPAALELFEGFTSGNLPKDEVFTSTTIKKRTFKSTSAVTRGLDAMKQVGIVTLSVGTESKLSNEYFFPSLESTFDDNESLNASGEVAQGSALLRRLREDIISIAGESTEVREAYMGAAAAGLLERVMQNELFDPSTRPHLEYTSLLLDGSQRETLEDMFIHIEKGEVDTSKQYSPNSLHSVFPSDIFPDKRASRILLSVGLLKYYKTGRANARPVDNYTKKGKEHDPLDPTGLFSKQTNDGTDAPTSAEMKIALQLIDEGEDDPRVLANISGVTGQEAYQLLELKPTLNQESIAQGQPVVHRDMKEGQTVTLPTGEVVVLVAKGNELFARYRDPILNETMYIHASEIA